MSAYVEILPDFASGPPGRRSPESSYSYTQDQQSSQNPQYPETIRPIPPEEYNPGSVHDSMYSETGFLGSQHPPDNELPPADVQSQEVVPRLRRTSRHTSLGSRGDLHVSLRSDGRRESAPPVRRSGSERKPSATFNFDDVLSLFVNSRKEAKDMRSHLKTTLDKLEQARQRADKAERLAGQLAGRVAEVSDERANALREASTAHEELGMYKLQYSNAQRELQRGNQALQDSEARRDEAEEAAARARETARNMRTMLLVERAKEEGRLEGFKQGMRAQGHAYYADDLDYDDTGEHDRREAREALDEILGVDQSYDDGQRTPRAASPPIAVPETPTQPPPAPPPPFEPQVPSGGSLFSQPFVVQPSQESFFTPTPAPRSTDARRPESLSTDTTSTLPLAPSAYVPPTSGALRMPTIPETLSQRTSIQTSVPAVVNTERTNRDSVRRSRPPSQSGTPRVQSVDIPPASYAPVHPPGNVERPPPPTVIIPPPPPIRPSSRSSIRGVGSPNMTTKELQRLAAESRQSFADSRRDLADELRGPPQAVPRQSARPSGPPRSWVPGALTMPQQLGPGGPPPNAASSQTMYAAPASPVIRPSSRAHSRSQSVNSPVRAPIQVPPNATPARPDPRPLHRRSTSTGTPNIFLESPSDPDLSFARQREEVPPALQPGREYLSPNSASVPLPSAPTRVRTPASPSPTSTARGTPRSASQQLPQQYTPQLHPDQQPQNPYPPQRFPPQIYASPTDPRPPQQFPPRLDPSQSPVDTHPPNAIPPRIYADAPSRPRSGAGMVPGGYPSAIPSHLYGAPTRPRSSQGMTASPRMPPMSVPAMAPSSSSGIVPSPQASPRMTAAPLNAPNFYGGQQPVPIPPRNASPAPLMVPSPEIASARLSNAGATPRVPSGHLRSPSGSVSHLPPGSPARSTSPLRGEPGSLYTHWDSRSVEDMGDMSGLAVAASGERPPAGSSSGRKGGSRRR